MNLNFVTGKMSNAQQCQTRDVLDAKQPALEQNGQLSKT